MMATARLWRMTRPGRELAARADVLIENFKPGGLAKYGLDYETVRALNPGLVYASITGFGSGAGSHVPGYDLMVQAISGLMSLTGDPAGPPYRAGISVFDVMAGNHAVIGILAALRHRDLQGLGRGVLRGGHGRQADQQRERPVHGGPSPIGPEFSPADLNPA